MNELRWGTPAGAGSNRIRPSVLLASHSGHRSFVSDTLRRSAQLLPALLTPWGKASSLFGGRILKCLPHPSAPSAARTVAGPTLENERAAVGDSCPGWLEQNSALCSPGFTLRASLVRSEDRRIREAAPPCSAQSRWDGI